MKLFVKFHQNLLTDVVRQLLSKYVEKNLSYVGKRAQNLDPNPIHHQNLITLSLSKTKGTHQISSKSRSNFVSHVVLYIYIYITFWWSHQKEQPHVLCTQLFKILKMVPFYLIFILLVDMCPLTLISSLSLYDCLTTGWWAVPQEHSGFPSDRPSSQAAPSPSPFLRTILQWWHLLRGLCHASCHGASGNSFFLTPVSLFALYIPLIAGFVHSQVHCSNWSAAVWACISSFLGTVPL